MNDLIVVERIAGWEKLKALLLDSVSSSITKRVYNMALNEFPAWVPTGGAVWIYQATVSAWRVSLEERRLGSSSIIIRRSAIRKLAAAASHNGLLARELAARISRVKSAKTQGIRTGACGEAIASRRPKPTAPALHEYWNPRDQSPGSCRSRRDWRFRGGYR
jgi:hypothetical protein